MNEYVGGKYLKKTKSLGRRPFTAPLQILVLSVALMAAAPACSDPGRPMGLTPLDPNSRPGLGQTAVDSAGRKFAALPPGRPIREISLYDLAAGTVERFVDPDTQADYSSEGVALSRDGKILFAVRHYRDIGRYPDLVAIDLETRTILKLQSKAAGFLSLAPDSTGRYLFYFRDVADRLESLNGNPEGKLEHRLDHSAPGPYRQIARYDLETGREDLQTTLIFKDGALLTATSRRLIFSAMNTFADFQATHATTKQGEAYLRFVDEQAPFVSSADPPGIKRRSLDFYHATLPVSPQPAATVVRVDRARAIDLGLDGVAEARAFEASRLQISDDEHFLLGPVRPGQFCWGMRSAGGAMSCNWLDENPVINLRITMSFDGASAIISKTAPVKAGRVTWCRIPHGGRIDECQWRAENRFSQKVIELRAKNP